LLTNFFHRINLQLCQQQLHGYSAAIAAVHVYYKDKLELQTLKIKVTLYQSLTDILCVTVCNYVPDN